ncbi:hypothetical protein BAY59_29450 [Prauserella coralliicola]|nr:hypothetical protein BAY59_29450 [Prauserella coralliicola]
MHGRKPRPPRGEQLAELLQPGLVRMTGRRKGRHQTARLVRRALGQRVANGVGPADLQRVDELLGHAAQAFLLAELFHRWFAVLDQQVRRDRVQIRSERRFRSSADRSGTVWESMSSIAVARVRNGQPRIASSSCGTPRSRLEESARVVQT